MGQKIFLDSIYQSMQDSARQVRLSLGRPSSRATRQQALQQVAMLKAAIASYATASITASCNAEGSAGGPANWQIDECLEDMHPANIFIDTLTGKPICIDCIVKFVK